MTRQAKIAIKSASRYALFRALRTLAYGAVFVALLLAPKALPASYFIDVRDLTFCPAGVASGKCPGLDHHTVRQLRRVWWPVRLHWSASLTRLHALQSGPGDIIDVRDTICHGSGSYTYEPSERAFFMDVDVWTGADNCSTRIIPGARYVPRAQWTFEFLIWTWTERHEGEPVMVPPRTAAG